MTLTQLINAVKAYGYGSENDTVITTFLNLAYMDVSSRFRWRYTENLASVATSANVATTLISPTYLFLGDLMSLSSSVPTPTFIENKSQVDDLHRDLGATATVRGKPTVYTVVGAQLYWFPVPDAVYQYRLYVWTAPAELSGGSDTPAFSAAFHQVLVEGALMHLASRDHNMQGVQDHRDRYEALIRALAMKDRARNSGSTHLYLPTSYGGMYDN